MDTVLWNSLLDDAINTQYDWRVVEASAWRPSHRRGWRCSFRSLSFETERRLVLLGFVENRMLFAFRSSIDFTSIPWRTFYIRDEERRGETRGTPFQSKHLSVKSSSFLYSVFSSIQKGKNGKILRRFFRLCAVNSPVNSTALHVKKCSKEAGCSWESETSFVFFLFLRYFVCVCSFLFSFLVENVETETAASGKAGRKQADVKSWDQKSICTWKCHLTEPPSM